MSKRSSIFLRLGTLTFAMAGLLTVTSGCGAKEFFNCREICSRKKECGNDSNYNVDNCTDYCSNRANNSDDYARNVNSTKECLNGLSCQDSKTITCFGMYSLSLP